MIWIFSRNFLTSIHEKSEKIHKRFQEDRLKWVRLFSFKSVHCVGEIKWLASYLFVLGDYDDCCKVCSFMDGMTFTGDRTIWLQVKVQSISSHHKSELDVTAWETAADTGQEIIKEWNGEYYEVTPAAQNTLPEQHGLMSEWICKITDFKIGDDGYAI